MNDKRLNDGSWVTGLILVGIGIVALAGQLFTITGWLVLAAISAVFFALWITTRRYGFSIPAMILAGLAVGVGWEDSLTSQTGGEVLVGLAAGFFGIYIVNVFSRMRASWWPLIPGTIIGIIGVSLVLEETQYAEAIGRLWPLGLIIVGVIVLAGTFLGERKPSTPAA